MGVDIWTHLYPTSFEKAFAFDSFSAFDLDSVDNGIISALNPLLEDQNEWDFIICHYFNLNKENLIKLFLGHFLSLTHSHVKNGLGPQTSFWARLNSYLDSFFFLSLQ